ncbi:hypothetical protein EC957_010158 [Mortierella hygrophila]|uniref:Uncharacterized protein n=1 Tax=Mortierella hygrophila TaxID=979708 RepID=A0A9P6FAX4_9FUNG|nr:hypothetical protein EC957_010158 [Mortierella hygrophila]
MPSVSFHMGAPSHATGRRALVTIPATEMNLENLTDRDHQVDRVRTLSHDIMYFLHAVGLWVTILYQDMVEERQLKCRNWIGFFLPLFTIMSDPRLAFLREASAPILFVAWLVLASEWRSAFSDTTTSMAHGYALDAVYAFRVGCYHGDSVCYLLSWYIWTIFGISLCFFAELVSIIYIQHREDGCNFFVGLFRRLLGRPAIPASASSSASRIAPVSEKTTDLETYDYSSVGLCEASPAGAQTPTIIDIFHFDRTSPPSYVPAIPHNASQLDGSVSLRACKPLSHFVLDQDKDEVFPKILPKDRSFLLQEGSFVVSAPAHVGTPRPLTRSFTSVAQMLGLDISGPRLRPNVPYSHHVQYVGCEPIVTKILMVHSIEYGQNLFLPAVVAVAAGAVHTDGQGAIEGATECVDQSTCSPHPQSVVASAVEEDAVEGTTLSELELSPSPQPQFATAADQGTAVEEAFQSLPFPQSQGEESDEETLANDDDRNKNTDAADDETEEVGYRYGQYDLDEYRKLLRERRLHAYRTVARTQMLELAKYANDPLPDYPQQ